MYFKDAAPEDFEVAFQFIEALWTYNTYDRQLTEKIYHEVLADPQSFAFFVMENDTPLGFCHGTYFNTFWLQGKTCYLSSIITAESVRGQGYGRALLEETKRRALAEHCKGIVLDSGLPRQAAHAFYEKFGFDKSCYGFDLIF